MLDAGANAECQPQWLVQFAQMGAVFARDRYGIDKPRVALLSIGEEPSKGTALVKETHVALATTDALSAAGAEFIGNVEGRDLLTGAADVVVADGFTGNVALKTLEGGLGTVIRLVLEVFATNDETKAAADTLMPYLLPIYESLTPDNVGGAMLLGVNGVCIISHGSSSARAIVNAVRVAADLVRHDVVAELHAAVAP
jgi:glycerol-3-phosphate acyltransferase PlsX